MEIPRGVGCVTAALKWSRIMLSHAITITVMVLALVRSLPTGAIAPRRRQAVDEVDVLYREIVRMTAPRSVAPQ